MRRKRRTARTKIAAVVKWAQQVGYYNIAAELNDALALLPPGKRTAIREAAAAQASDAMTADKLPAVLPSGAIASASPIDTYIVPALVAASGHDAIDRFLSFFATQIENDNTREAYLRAAREFLGWCERHELTSACSGSSGA
jgi:hypothetical protein